MHLNHQTQLDVHLRIYKIYLFQSPIFKGQEIYDPDQILPRIIQFNLYI